MASERPLGFWRTLPKMRQFRWGLVGLTLGLAVCVGFLATLKAPRDAVIFTLSTTLVVGAGMVVRACYRTYSESLTAIERTYLTALNNPATQTREQLALLPLIPGSVVGIYLLVHARLSMALISMGAGLAAWLLLRLVLNARPGR